MFQGFASHKTQSDKHPEGEKQTSCVIENLYVQKSIKHYFIFWRYITLNVGQIWLNVTNRVQHFKNDAFSLSTLVLKINKAVSQKNKFGMLK